MEIYRCTTILHRRILFFRTQRNVYWHWRLSSSNWNGNSSPLGSRTLRWTDFDVINIKHKTLTFVSVRTEFLQWKYIQNTVRYMTHSTANSSVLCFHSSTFTRIIVSNSHSTALITIMRAEPRRNALRNR